MKKKTSITSSPKSQVNLVNSSKSSLQLKDNRPQQQGFAHLFQMKTASPNAGQLQSFGDLLNTQASVQLPPSSANPSPFIQRIKSPAIENLDNLLQGKFESVQKSEIAEEELLQGKLDVRQRVAMEEEELLQGKFESVQKSEIAEEELLQGKLDVRQRVAMEEEELLQGKFESVQKSEIAEEELLQGKLDVKQRVAMEEEELLQGKFESVQKSEIAEEELLQGKLDVRQRVAMEEEELLQGKFESRQLKEMEEEDPLQGKMNVFQREGQENTTGLPDQLKLGIEQLSGYSLDDVNVHYNSEKPAQIQAHAYAQGNDIHIGAGQEKHLAHEAWHVVQQMQGRVKPTLQLQGKVAVNDDKGLEKEADVMGRQAMQRTVSESVGKNFILPSKNEGYTEVFQSKQSSPIQRALSKDAPILAADVANVTNPHGNVYILTGHAGDSVVVKFEVAGAEGIDKYKARYELSEELAMGTLSGAVTKNQLTSADITQLKLIPAGLGHSGNLLQVLNAGIDQAAVGIKMDQLAMGDNLHHMANNNPAGQNDQQLKGILKVNKARRYGEMAFFDLLTRNYDRFRQDGSVAANNIDFNTLNTEVVPLDNIYFNLSLTGGNWQQELSEMDALKPANRQTFADTVIDSLIQATGLPQGTFGSMAIASAKNFFLMGVNDAHLRAAGIIQRWNNTKLGVSRESNETIDARNVLKLRFEKV